MGKEPKINQGEKEGFLLFKLASFFKRGRGIKEGLGWLKVGKEFGLGGNQTYFGTPDFGFEKVLTFIKRVYQIYHFGWGYRLGNLGKEKMYTILGNLRKVLALNRNLKRCSKKKVGFIWPIYF